MPEDEQDSAARLEVSDRRSAVDVARIPVTVVGGYLGSGKTTAVNHFLRSHTGARVVVVVNDFGSVDIDGALVESQADDLITLANGCVCCSLGGGLVSVLRRIAAMGDRPERVILETSGVADPWSVAQYAQSPGFCLAGVVVLADATSVRSRATDRFVGKLVRRQLVAADLVAVTKLDLVDAERRAEIFEWLAIAAGSHVPLLDAPFGQLPVRSFDTLDRGGVLRRPPVENRAAGRWSSGPDAPSRHVGLSAWTFESGAPLHAMRAESFAAALPGGIARAKGILQVAEYPDRRTVLQVADGRVTLEPGGPWDGAVPRSTVVVIGAAQAFDAAALRAALAQYGLICTSAPDLHIKAPA